MKIIHCSDLHLGCALNDFEDGGEERRREIRATFGRIANYAANNGVAAIILAGDVFDSDRPFMRDKKFFYDVVEAHKDIDFIYLRGNHDNAAGYERAPSNLRTFTDRWKGYRYDDADIYGAELPYRGDMYGELQPRINRFNIVVLHGQINAHFLLSRLKNRNIDYLALGHIHSYSTGRLDARGQYAYCGCPEGRGFDETGEKGFILLDTAARKFSFIPFASRLIAEYDADISGCGSAYEAAERIMRQYPSDGRTIARINLCGSPAFSDGRLAEEIKEYLSAAYYRLSVRDRTTAKADYSALAAKPTLAGQFYRSVMSDGRLSPEMKERVLSAGLTALGEATK